MSRARPRGATLVVGLILLSLVTLLGLAGASVAHVERQLAWNEQFRETAESAASAGLEIALARIASGGPPEAMPVTLSGQSPEGLGQYEVAIRFAGLETALPQATAGDLVGAHFEIVSTGRAARNAADRQIATVMRVDHSASAAPQPCGPEAAGRRCHVADELLRLSWHRVALE